jgi:hypothetical protein
MLDLVTAGSCVFPLAGPSLVNHLLDNVASSQSLLFSAMAVASISPQTILSFFQVQVRQR